jgi:hypothetical protein
MSPAKEVRPGPLGTREEGVLSRRMAGLAPSSALLPATIACTDVETFTSGEGLNKGGALAQPSP